jgi:ferredoxin
VFWRKVRPYGFSGPAVRCSFCNKSQRDVAKIVAGPEVNICSECVEICRDVLERDVTLVEPMTQEEFEGSERLISGNEAIRCALCAAVRPLAESLRIPGRGWLCRACAEAAQDGLRGKP